MVWNEEVLRQQREICDRYGARWQALYEDMKVGIAENVKLGVLPINGLRHPLEGDTAGWYIWAGDVLSDTPDFFRPLHVKHVGEWCPGIVKYLGLPPGWRFLTDLDKYEDVWEDLSLLKI